MFKRLFAPTALLAGLALAPAANAGSDPVATAPIPPPSQAAPAHPAPAQPLFVAPTVETPHKAAPPAPPKTAAAKPAKPPKTVAAAAPKKPVRHAKKHEPRQYYARVYPRGPSPYAMPQDDGPPMPPPGWYGRGYMPDYGYPGPRMGPW